MADWSSLDDVGYLMFVRRTVIDRAGNILSAGEGRTWGGAAPAEKLVADYEAQKQRRR